MSAIIGIDLGTTNSCISVVQGGTPRIIENAEGGRTTPSIVAWKDGEVLTGQTAKRQAVTNAENTVFAVKRLMGRRFDEKNLKAVIKHLPYQVVKGKNGDAWVSVEGKEMSPPEVSAQLLMRLKKAAEDFLGSPVSGAVITVPAYFNDSQRQATQAAGRIAGLEVKRIINEPTAAALAFGLDKAQKNARVAVYDLGGGTYDISIIEMAEVDGEHQFEVLSTNGDTMLGGEDFDRCLIEHLVAEFKKEQGIDLSQDPLALQRLKEAAEKAKTELSSNQQTDINLPYITADKSGPKHLAMKLTRAKLEALVGDLVDRTVGPMDKALKDAKLKPSDIDECILVGGQTRMPLVQKRIAEFFGKEARKDVNPDEAVALGAAIQGAVLSGERSDVLLLDVTPLTLGVETLGGVMQGVIERNTTIPTQRSQVFSTAADNQPEVTVHILQGERKQAKENKSLGQFNLSGIDPAPKGMPQIEITFDIDANGILNVSAVDKNSGKEQSIEVKGSSGLSEGEIERMVKEAESHAEDDRKFEELVTARNAGEALVHSARKMVGDQGDAVSEDERTAVEEAAVKLEEACKGEDVEAISAASAELGKAVEPVAKREAEKIAAEQEASDSDSDDGGTGKAKAAADANTVDAEFEAVDEGSGKSQNKNSGGAEKGKKGKTDA